MPALLDTEFAHAMRRAAVFATRAPSIGNTQPWRLMVRAGELQVHADLDRRLRQLDPIDRQLLISCGCAVLNARVALASLGVATDIDYLPDPDAPTLVARLTPTGLQSAFDGDVGLAALVRAVGDRRSARAGFLSTRVPSIPSSTSRTAALIVVPEQRMAELRGAVDAAEADVRPAGASRTAAPARWVEAPAAAVVVTAGDGRDAWVRAGEEYQRFALELTTRGLSCLASWPAVEDAGCRHRVAGLLPDGGRPQLVVGFGHARPCPPTRRRRLVDQLQVG